MPLLYQDPDKPEASSPPSEDDLALAKMAILRTKVAPQLPRFHGLAEEDIPWCIGNLEQYTLAASSMPIHRIHMKWISRTFRLMTKIDVMESVSKAVSVSQQLPEDNALAGARPPRLRNLGLFIPTLADNQPSPMCD